LLVICGGQSVANKGSHRHVRRKSLLGASMRVLLSASALDCLD
jgi:hypothetical protein